jgi:hypothetical protein
VFWLVFPLVLTFVDVLLGLLVPALGLGPAVPGFEAPVFDPPAGPLCTRVSLPAAVPPCGFTDWLAVGPAALSPVPPPVTFWFAFVFWLVLALVFTFVLVFVGVNVLWIVGAVE